MLRQINPIHQKELIETSYQLRKALRKHMAVIKEIDPWLTEREKTGKFKKELIECFGKCCGICNSDKKIEAHHIIPLEIGSETKIDNLILLCAEHHKLFHEGRISINSMKEAASEWRKGKIVSLKIKENINVKPSITDPPPTITDILNKFLIFQQRRETQNADLLLREVHKDDKISGLDKNYLFISFAEITRRRDAKGVLNKALAYLDNVYLDLLPKEYIGKYYYEKLYIHRLAGFHEKASKIADLSIESSLSLKKSKDKVKPLEYVPASTNKLLCELAEYEYGKLKASQVKYFVDKLTELEKIARSHGGYWGGRWAVNCAGHRLQVYIKANNKKSFGELENVKNLYYDLDSETGWDSGFIQSISLLAGLTNILISNKHSEVDKGVKILARSFVSRFKKKQRIECIRDAGFGLAIGLRKLNKHLKTADVLSNAMNRTIDGTSYIWPWIAS